MDGIAPPRTVTVYWRPGCPSCAVLRRGLRRSGLPASEVNIWTDPEGAAAVRQVTGGDETVPTVLVGGRSLVNPSTAAVIEAARQAGIEAAAPPGPPTGGSLVASLPAVQWMVIVALILAGFGLDGGGQAAAGWVVDAVAVAVYLLFQALRHRIGRAETGT